MSATAQTDRQQGAVSDPGLLWYSPSPSAHSGPDPLGGYCHPVKILAALNSPFRSLIGADLYARFGRGMPVLIAGDLNTKHEGWNSRLNTTRGKVLCDYADGNSCLIFGPDTPTTKPYNPLATPYALDIVITMTLISPVYLTSCSAQSSDHLPVLIETTCRSFFQNQPDRADFRRTAGPTSKLTLKIKFRSIWNYTTGWQLTCGLRTFHSPS
jgi:hypothetical protein